MRIRSLQMTYERIRPTDAHLDEIGVAISRMEYEEISAISTDYKVSFLITMKLPAHELMNISCFIY